MKKILVFSFFPAFVPPSNGGEARLFNFYKSLSKFHHVTLLTLTHLNAAEEKINHGSNFVERRIPKDFHFAEKWAELTPHASGGDLSAPVIAACGGLPTLLHSAYLDEYTAADIIIHDSPFTIDYDLFFDVDSKIRIYNAYNCEASLYKTLHPEAKSQLLWEIVEAAEVKILNGCDVVLYCNKADLDEFTALAPDSKYAAIFAPNGMSPLSNATRNHADSQRDSVVFIGSGHPPNVKAALEITNNIAPELPHLTFHIIGGCLPDGRYPKNVIKHGFVDEDLKNKLISEAGLAINPMENGSGSNVKVFEFFSYGVPVLSSQFGMRGINSGHEENCLIAPIEEFSETITSWLDRYHELQKIGENGRTFAAENYSWDVIAKDVAKQLLGIEKNSDRRDKFILVLNDYNSFKNSGGGGVRTRGIYSAVNDWSYVVFICFSENNEITVRHENAKTIVFSIPKTDGHIEESLYVNSLFHVSADDLIASQHCMSNTFLVSIYIILKNICRNVVIEHPYMVSLPIAFKDRFIYSSQNHEAKLKKDLLKNHPRYEDLINLVENIERKAVECASAIIAVSENDAHSLVRGARTAGPVIVAHNGASAPLPPDEEELNVARKAICREASALFVGSAHMPNIEALKYIVEILAPASPFIEFHIVGSVCDAFLSDTPPSDALPANIVGNVHFWGVLSETMKSAVMQSCGIALNSVNSGGGSNIKLADYFANGLYVVTTPFGLRGYPDPTRKHLIEAELSDFESAVKKALQKVKDEDSENSSIRQKFFTNHLSMKGNAQKVVSLLRRVEKEKKKVLFVTYRYTNPALGGAESMLENLIAVMDSTDEFQIDLVSPKINRMNNQNRFSEHYDCAENLDVKIGLNNVRFAQFPLDDEVDISQDVTEAWRAQPFFEKEVYLQLNGELNNSGLAWGWGEPDNSSAVSRWGYTSCGLHLHKKTKVFIKCYSPHPIVIWLKDQHDSLIKVQEAKGKFFLEFTALAGAVDITTSAPTFEESDVRPLAFCMSELFFDDQAYDLADPILTTMLAIEDKKRFHVLDEASKAIREPLNIDLTTMRGPFSSRLENFIESNVQNYDLVITHNNIFRPAVIAVDRANKNGVPIICIPHAHLDDDFYHFPDVHQSVVNSSLVLAAPKIACDFYKHKGANVGYLPAGIDTHEIFGADDIIAFKKVCAIEVPFILVLGRKSNAKGYRKVIDAAEHISKEMDVHVVIIGPDDDNYLIDSSCASYLGRQSREAVRGALLSCKALVNMSSSESFGIVLLEAWMAGKPVIVNDACAAFHDLAIDGHNALMVKDTQSLQEAIIKVISDPALCEHLAENGRKILPDYDWYNIGDFFVDECNKLISGFISNDDMR